MCSRLDPKSFIGSDAGVGGKERDSWLLHAKAILILALSAECLKGILALSQITRQDNGTTVKPCIYTSFTTSLWICLSSMLERRFMTMHMMIMHLSDAS